MTYRHEWKHEINYQDRLILQTRLAAVMRPDPHAIDGRYRIRSLYFDTPADTALREKIDGVNRREKFRIRYYNGDTSYIVLEKKSKLNGLCAKESCRLTAEEARRKRKPAARDPNSRAKAAPSTQKACLRKKARKRRSGYCSASPRSFSRPGCLWRQKRNTDGLLFPRETQPPRAIDAEAAFFLRRKT